MNDGRYDKVNLELQRAKAARLRREALNLQLDQAQDLEALKTILRSLINVIVR